MDFETLKALALDAGFTGAWAFDPRGLRFLPQVREMCRADRCSSYGKNWTCPPACGSLEEAAAQAAGYTRGILLQTMARLEDEFDLEGMEAAGARHKESFDRFCGRVKALGLAGMPMGMGACTRCKVCTYPSAPCRFPEKAVPSMEARGLQVSDVCRLAGAPYYYGPAALAYSSCFLYGPAAV